MLYTAVLRTVLCLSLALLCHILDDTFDFLITGKEFERVIDSHGPDHVSALMQKVISALEHLEQFAAAGDAEDDTVEQLRTTITHYELDEAKRTEERQRINRVS